MHGAGNDFIVVDDRDLTFPVEDRAWIASVGMRRTGVGCDGFVLLQPSESADLRMRFFNPDGREAEMCGNGARCFARLAFDLGAAPRWMQIETAAGIIWAEVCDEQVRLQLADPADWRMGLELGGTVDFVNTGVPHAVVKVENLSSIDLPSEGRGLRQDATFAPAGANVDFIQLYEDGVVGIRTYERGVEGETLACGTGVAAAAVVAVRRGWSSFPVSVQCASGDTLLVDGELTESGVGRVSLTGPAVYVYEGLLTR
jgi:diaminopimelate epimerase